jgi:SPP1 gp7 family putative phage head morphogenesis protein
LSAAFNNPLLIGAKGGAVDFSKYTKQWKPQEIERVVGVINGGFFAGDTTDQIVRSVNGLKSHRFADGILNTSRANIESMVRTSLNHQAVAARAVYGKENGDIIKGEKIVATLDIRTSAECKDRDGDEVLYVDDKNPARPPFHINCRSSFVYLYDPEFDFLNRGATRASKGAEGGQQVPQKQTYYTWLKNQPAFIQDEALGVQKGLIFRNAGLSPDEFKKVATDRFKKPLTIQQLSQKDKRIAEYLDK